MPGGHVVIMQGVGGNTVILSSVAHQHKTHHSDRDINRKSNNYTITTVIRIRGKFNKI